MDSYEALIRLAACAVNNDSADVSDPDVDFDALFELAEKHQMVSLIAAVLESNGIRDDRFVQERAKAIRKALIFDSERAAILSALEKARIWYMPLKGAVLKDYYPQIGMRQMSDNDILVDPARSDDVYKIMTGLGYTAVKYGTAHRDDYTKPPVSHFELHRVLFLESNGEGIYRYYRDVKDRLVKDEGNSYGFHFTDEDFYIYMIAHEYKHYASGGTGVRSLLDTYVFLKKLGDKLDWDYIGNEFNKLDIAEFEAKNRELALAVFTSGDLGQLCADQKEMLAYFFSSGMYGTIEHSVANGIKESGKLKYVLHRIFLPMDKVKDHYPVFYKHKALLPVLPIYRLLRGWKNAEAEFKAVRKF